jgi:hypothetical protein
LGSYAQLGCISSQSMGYLGKTELGGLDLPHLAVEERFVAS